MSPAASPVKFIFRCIRRTTLLREHSSDPQYRYGAWPLEHPYSNFRNASTRSSNDPASYVANGRHTRVSLTDGRGSAIALPATRSKKAITPGRLPRSRNLPSRATTDRQSGGKHPALIAFVDGVTAAAIGAIAGAVIVLAQRSITDVLSGALALATVALLWRFKKLQEPIIVAVAALIGLIAYPLLHE